jgi:hypothetical protein
MSSSNNNFLMLAAARYPVSDSMYPEMRARNLRLRGDYVFMLEQCRTNPAYFVRMPNGLDDYPAHCEPFTEDDTKGWITVRRKIRVKRVKTDEELNYEAAQMHDYWEAESVDSQSYVLPSGEHNGALFDIGARF